MNIKEKSGLSIELDKLTSYNQKAVKVFIQALLVDYLDSRGEISFSDHKDIDGNEKTKMTVKNIKQIIRE